MIDVSVSTAACETSLAVPAVVGRQTSGSIGPGTLSKLKYLPRLAAMRQQNGDHFRQVHVAAAAQPEHAIGPEIAWQFRPQRLRSFTAGSGSPPR